MTAPAVEQQVIVVGIKNSEIEFRGHKPPIEDTYGPADQTLLSEVLECLGLSEIHSMRMSSDMDHPQDLGFPEAMSFFQRALDKALAKLSGHVPMRNRFKTLRKPPAQKKRSIPRKPPEKAKKKHVKPMPGHTRRRGRFEQEIIDFESTLNRRRR